MFSYVVGNTKTSNTLKHAPHKKISLCWKIASIHHLQQCKFN